MPQKRTADPLAGFDALTDAVVDASSIIYMQKAGFLETAGRFVELHAPDAVIQEVGAAEVPITLHAFDCRQHCAKADQQLLALARILGTPLISEDKKVLLSAERNGLVYYNAFMVLNFLFYKSGIAAEDAERYLRALLAVARYSERVVIQGRAVMRRIAAGR